MIMIMIMIIMKMMISDLVLRLAVLALVWRLNDLNLSDQRTVRSPERPTACHYSGRTQMVITYLGNILYHGAIAGRPPVWLSVYRVTLFGLFNS